VALRSHRCRLALWASAVVGVALPLLWARAWNSSGTHPPHLLILTAACGPGVSSGIKFDCSQPLGRPASPMESVYASTQSVLTAAISDA
jgi:hypothetical protein